MKKKIDILLIIFFIIATAALVVSLIPSIKIFPDEKINTIFKDSLARFFFGLFFIYLIFTSKYKEQLRFHFEPKSLLWAIPVILVALVNFPYSSLIMGTAKVTKMDYLGVLIFYCLAVSLLEEMFFRIILFNFIFEKLSNKKYPYILSVIITSLIFGVWHFINLITGAQIIATLIQVGYTTLIGCMLSVTFTKTKNIYFCILVHSVFDFGGFIINILGEGSFQDMWFWILTIVCGVFCGIHILFTSIKIEKQLSLNNE